MINAGKQQLQETIKMCQKHNYKKNFHLGLQNNKLVCVNASKQITFFPQEYATDNWLV
jgi:hypothetical protein